MSGACGARRRRRRSPDSDGSFVARPHYREQVHETGPAARLRGEPLVRELEAAHGMGLLTRMAARLADLLMAPERMRKLYEALSNDNNQAPAAGGIAALGGGLGIVENARGRLVHRVTLCGERIERYCILAPTEWNFHPDGLLAQSLTGASAVAELRERVEMLVAAVDPCVEFSVRIQAQE